MYAILEKIPDSTKITTAAIAPVLNLFGMPLDQWVLILSILLTLLFIVEKIPKALLSIKWMYRAACHKPNEPLQ